MANMIRKGERGPGSLVRSNDPLRMDPLQMMRDLFRWDPFREMQPMGTLAERVFNPEVEFKETKDAYLCKADLPGIQEKDLEISVTGNRLHIRGRREEEETHEEDRYYAYERSYGSFSRSFTLPEGANADEVTAELKDGVLDIRIPKRADVQARRVSLQSPREQQEKGKVEDKKKAA
ncbi:Hsp20/alpha crystallin family protein [Chondromyces crocatus]|uniref:Spore protein SP21 n=1 Tax=Chondromyces crocatus TaxID=52 RepID=A0A0K1EK26_CHOCO|nr:Hsp20/alpha crystallin family protein [Chondromyces crocatus]AKT41211.1 spore protein SP21 [Chondromyces crocatus]